MKILLYALAIFRAIILFGTMIIFILSFLFSTIFVANSKERAFKLRKSWLKYIAIPVLNIKVIKTGNIINNPAIYVSNHRSFSDPIILCHYINGFVIAKAEVANYPIINKGAEITGVIWVDRNNQNSRTDTRNKLVETIESGYNIIVYPEGTVGQEKQPLPFKKGTFYEAFLNNIEVVPVAIEYKSERDLWILQKFIPQYLHQFSKWRTEVKISFGAPLLNVSSAEELHTKAYEWVKNETEIMQHNWSDTFS